MYISFLLWEKKSIKLLNMTETRPDFPLHATIKAQDEDGTDLTYVMCLWSEEDDLCAHKSSDFEAFLNHLNKQHGLKLTPGVDCSVDSSAIFQNRLDAIEFYLAKIMTYEDLSVKMETPMNDNLTAWLAPIFEELKGIRKQVVDRLLFEGESFDDTTDEILKDIDSF